MNIFKTRIELNRLRIENKELKEKLNQSKLDNIEFKLTQYLYKKVDIRFIEYNRGRSYFSYIHEYNLEGFKMTKIIRRNGIIDVHLSSKGIEKVIPVSISGLLINLLLAQ